MTPHPGAMSRAATILRANAREAVDSLRKAQLRAILGVVGITVGISSVIAMVSLGEVAREEARSQFEALGADVLVVRKAFATWGERTTEIAMRDAMVLAKALPAIAEAAPRVQSQGEFRFGGRRIGEGNVQGVTQAFLEVNRLSLQSGRFISDFDADQPFCVLGAGLADSIRETGADRIVGEVLEVDETLFTVTGVLDHAEESYALPLEVDANDSVFVPIATSRRIVADPGIDVIVARAHPEVHYATAAAEIRSFFHRQSPSLEIEIVAARQLIARMEAQMGIFTLLLGAVGSISLIVGGIGIMNIMLVSVSERRREIAVRRALGARHRDIQSQFLVESLILTMAGGLLGILSGLTVTWAICEFTGWRFLISGSSVASGLITAAATGLFFGFQPAYRASRLDPIAGLQGD